MTSSTRRRWTWLYRLDGRGHRNSPSRTRGTPFKEGPPGFPLDGGSDSRDRCGSEAGSGRAYEVDPPFNFGEELSSERRQRGVIGPGLALRHLAGTSRRSRLTRASRQHRPSHRRTGPPRACRAGRCQGLWDLSAIRRVQKSPLHRLSRSERLEDQAARRASTTTRGRLDVDRRSRRTPPWPRQRYWRVRLSAVQSANATSLGRLQEGDLWLAKVPWMKTSGHESLFRA